MVKVSSKELNDFYVPVPPIEKQQSIVDEIQAEIKKQEIINIKIANLRKQIDEFIENTITKRV